MSDVILKVLHLDLKDISNSASSPRVLGLCALQIRTVSFVAGPVVAVNHSWFYPMKLVRTWFVYHRSIGIFFR